MTAQFFVASAKCAVIDSAYSRRNMYLGKVLGNVVCSVQNESLTGRTLLLVRRLPKGPVAVAVDAVGAGIGETVYVCRGKEASFPFLPNEVPTETTIVAIVDPPSQ
jgi:ethanolamine utilization protein EutN